MQKQRKISNTTTSEIVLESLREQIINGIPSASGKTGRG